MATKEKGSEEPKQPGTAPSTSVEKAAGAAPKRAATSGGDKPAAKKPAKKKDCEEKDCSQKASS